MSQVAARTEDLALDHAKPSVIALLPLILFLAVFVGTGTYLTLAGVNYAFYELSPVTAIVPAIILALILGKLCYQQSLEGSLNTFIKGIGDNNIITMCLIYLLAGAFATVVKATGGVDATVALGLTLIPASLLLPGLFLISAFIATSMGTSMGTIGAVAPVAFGIAQQAGIEPALMAGVVISGAMFGDNLSIISDTTIAAARTQGAEMKDKFRANFAIAAPTAIITMILFTIAGSGQAAVEAQAFDAIKVLPYLAVLVLAVIGMNVFVVLGLGTVLAAVIAFGSDGYTLMTFGKDIYKGFSSMQEIFYLSMLVGGLAALMKAQGGLAWLTAQISNVIAKVAGKSNNQVSAELGIAALVTTTNLCVANNTVSIIVAGPVARNLAEDNQIAPRNSAATLDIFSCIVQGLVPYAAQALLVASTFQISPLQVIPNNWYCLLLAVTTIVVIVLRARKNR